MGCPRGAGARPTAFDLVGRDLSSAQVMQMQLLNRSKTPHIELEASRSDAQTRTNQVWTKEAVNGQE
jgi:hypothetical protein